MCSLNSVERVLKHETGTQAASAMNDNITSSGRKPKQVWSDKGTELYNIVCLNGFFTAHQRIRLLVPRIL
jgi:hypothetical protein